MAKHNWGSIDIFSQKDNALIHDKKQNDTKQRFIEKIYDGMSLEQKVGQLFVIGFTGTMVTAGILERIRKFHPAGIRVGLTFRCKTAFYDPSATSEKFAHRVIRKPSGVFKDFVAGIPVPWITNAEYCHVLNTLKKTALDNGDAPVHITVDMEGDASADYPRGGIHFFPSPMGLAVPDDPKMAYDVGWAIGRQLAPLGVSWIHSPVLDVNTNPLNPEIGTRSFGQTADVVTRYATELFKGLKEHEIICTGKHYPGRGACTDDAHSQLPVIGLNRRQMEEHFRPFAALSAAGLPAIMSAHTAYPHIDPSGLPASLSKILLSDILKGEFGFKGVITTDDITMGGIVERFEVADACVAAINAGNDLILFREEGNLVEEVFDKMLSAARGGKIAEARLRDAVLRTLGVKYDYGFFADGSGRLKQPTLADEGIQDPRVAQIADRAAKDAINVIDKANILPLAPDKKILVIEQVNPLHKLVNSHQCHPGMLWEHIMAYAPTAGIVEVELDIPPRDQQRILDRLDEADILIATNYYYRGTPPATPFYQRLACYGKQMVIITNTPYPFGICPEFQTVIISYGVGVESIRHIAKQLFW